MNDYNPSGQEAAGRKRKKRKKKNYLLRAVIAAAVIVCIVLLTHISCFDIKGVAVVGNDEISDEEILKTAEIEPGGSIFDVHPFLVERKVKKNLYIKDVNVDRKLPDEVYINVEERSCRAQFLKGKKYVVTDNEGMVIDIAGKEAKATLVENATVEEAELGDTIKIKEEAVYTKAMEFITLAEANDLYFKKINIKGNRIDAYVYNKLKCSGKYGNVVKSIKSGTLKKVLYDLYQKGREKGTVNVYNNDYCFFTPKK